jgi:hypothetical protein
MRDEEPSGVAVAEKRPLADMIFPALIVFAPYAICFLVGLTSVATIGCVSNEYANDSPALPGIEIYGNTAIGQTFTSRYNDLNSVDVLMQNDGRANSNGVLFHLKASPTSGDIAMVTMSAADIVNNKYHSFKFPTIPDSKDRTYYFSIESPQSNPGDAVTVLLNSEDGGSAYYGDQSIGDIVFRSHYKPGLPEIFSFIGSKYPIVSI